MAVFTSRRLRVPSKVNYVEYIQSSGTQYIDTGFMPNQNTRVVMDVAVLSSQTSEGHFASCTGDGYYYTLYVSAALLCGTRYGSQALKNVGSALTAGTRYTLDKNKNVTTANGSSVTHTVETFQMAYPLTLLCRNAAGTKARYVSARMYSCQIYDNETIVRDFRPCCDPDGVACMYDKVSQTYYYNAGTGAFTVG